MSEFAEVRTIILKDYQLIITTTEAESFYLTGAVDEAAPLFFPGYTVSRPPNLYKLLARTNGSGWLTLKWFFYGEQGDIVEEVDVHGDFMIYWK